MEYGILIAENHDGPELGGYQIIGPVDSIPEAKEHVANYLIHGPASDCLAPDSFVIMRRDQNGYYTIREPLAECDLVGSYN